MQGVIASLLIKVQPNLRWIYALIRGLKPNGYRNHRMWDWRPRSGGFAGALAQNPLQPALQKYAKSRLRHVRTYQLLSAVFTPMYQSDSRVLPFLRNWLFAPLTFVPPAPWLIRKIVCGDIVKPIKGLK